MIVSLRFEYSNTQGTTGYRKEAHTASTDSGGHARPADNFIEVENFRLVAKAFTSLFQGQTFLLDFLTS